MMKNFAIKILKWILKKLAQLTIWRFWPKIIAITGSVGKTSAKEAIFAVLNAADNSGYKKWRVRKSKGNFNNELGAPLAILGDWQEDELKLVSLETPAKRKTVPKFFFWIKVIFSSIFRLLFMRRESYPEILILEYGADRPGDIGYLLNIAKPHISVITAIGEMPVHLEFYNNLDSLVKEKAKLIECLPSASFAVLNFDDPMIAGLKEKTRARVVGFGFQNEAEVRIRNFENRSEGFKPFGASFKIEYGGSVVPIQIRNVFGRAQAYALTIAVCLGLIFDFNLVEIIEALSTNYCPPKQRMNVIKGINDSWIIDDTYNASPLSVKEALETLASLVAKRRIAVLGEMRELGNISEKAHQTAGQLAGHAVDLLITVGKAGKIIAQSAKSASLPQNKILHFHTGHDAAKSLRGMLKNGDLVLIKASRAVGLDKVVEAVKMK